MHIKKSHSESLHIPGKEVYGLFLFLFSLRNTLSEKESSKWKVSEEFIFNGEKFHPNFTIWLNHFFIVLVTDSNFLLVFSHLSSIFILFCKKEIEIQLIPCKFAFFSKLLFCLCKFDNIFYQQWYFWTELISKRRMIFETKIQFFLFSWN